MMELFTFSLFRKLVRSVEEKTLGITYRPVLVAARSKAWVYGRSLAGVVGSSPAGGMDVCLL